MSGCKIITRGLVDCIDVYYGQLNRTVRIDMAHHCVAVRAVSVAASLLFGFRRPGRRRYGGGGTARLRRRRDWS